MTKTKTTSGALAPTCGPRSCGLQCPYPDYPEYWNWYVLRCSDNSLYCGITKGDAYDRLKEHNAGRGSKYVRSKRPAVVVMRELVDGHSPALRKEAAFKKLSKKAKEKMVREYVEKRGFTDAYQDRCEGCGWASVGGKGWKPPADGVLIRPKYITEFDEPAYFTGYRNCMIEMGWKDE